MPGSWYKWIYLLSVFEAKQLKLIKLALIAATQSLDLKSDLLSTYTHGYSEAIFGATDLLGFSYAPLIKKLKKQSLYISQVKGITGTAGIYTDQRIVDDRTIDSHIKNLRRKTAVIDPNLDIIQSVYGVGYKYES